VLASKLSGAYKVYKESLRKLIEDKYPRTNLLGDFMINLIVDQLQWVQENAAITPQLNVKYQGSPFHLEISRALSRIECLLLLREVNDKNFGQLYSEFKKERKRFASGN